MLEVGDLRLGGRGGGVFDKLIVVKCSGGYVQRRREAYDARGRAAPSSNYSTSCKLTRRYKHRYHVSQRHKQHVYLLKFHAGAAPLDRIRVVEIVLHKVVGQWVAQFFAGGDEPASAWFVREPRVRERVKSGACECECVSVSKRAGTALPRR